MQRFTWLATCVAICGFAAAAMTDDSPTGEIFRDLDKNGDGKLTADEIPAAQMRFFERLIRIGDKNNDGELTKEEFNAAMDEREAPVDPPREEGRFREGPPPEIGQLFDRIDRDRDGKLTRDELRDLPEPMRDRFAALFDRAGKEALTRDEFLQALRSFRDAGGPGRGPQRGEGGLSLEILRRLDVNGDGRITREELPPELRERMSGIFERLGSDSIDLQRLAEFSQRREGGPDRPGMAFRDAERRPEEGRPRDGERRPEEGRPPFGFGDRRPEEGRPPFGPTPAFFRILDANGNGRISKAEMLRVAQLFDDLDRNGDGELDLAELMGFPGREGFRPEGGERPGRPDGERRPGEGRPPFEGERGRPEGRPQRPDGERPPRVEGERPQRPEGERP